MFEIELPPVPGGGEGEGGGGGSSSLLSCVAAATVNEAAGVGLAFYARIFVLKVGNESLCEYYVGCSHRVASITTAHNRRRLAGVQDARRG